MASAVVAELRGDPRRLLSDAVRPRGITDPPGAAPPDSSPEFRAVVVKEVGDWPWGATGDLLEDAGRVVVLDCENRPLAGYEQLSLPRRYAGRR